MSNYLGRVRGLSPKDRYIHWVKERESIRQHKEGGKTYPWTEDPILQDYRFCNVRRMDDKVSRWLKENWYEKFFDHPRMLPAVALARFINKPESLKEVTGVVFSARWKPDFIVAQLRKWRDKGNTVFNGAYMVRGNDGIDKIDCVVNHYIVSMFEDPPEYSSLVTINTDSMTNTHQRIQSLYGFGSFMAGQVTADLREAVPGKWEDRYDWFPQGPGSTRGLKRFWGGAENVGVTPSLKNSDFQEGMQSVARHLQQEAPGIYERLEGIDIQNTMCEFDKYERVLWGEGRPKQKYKQS